MTTNNNESREFDRSFDENNPPPVDSVVLEGIEELKRQLASDRIQEQIQALSEALNYGDRGLDLVIDALNSHKREIRKNAYELLQQREELKAKEAVNNYKFWSNFEYLDGLPSEHAKIFANRPVQNFDSKIGISDPLTIAYALREYSYHYREQEETEDLEEQFDKLLQDPISDKLEALVFGLWWYQPSSIIVNFLCDAYHKLINLKALFLGDIEDREMMISSIQQTDLSPLLAVYPNLEILHIRGSQGLQFNSRYLEQHNKLKAIRIETGGLPREAINGLCALKLPALEYLELWMGSPDYGGNSTIDDLMPIIAGEAFPNLKYLGLRDAEYTDEIALELVKSPLLNNLIELDLSLGTLGKEGGEALANCPAVNELDTLNVSKNFLARNCYFAPKLLTLDCEVIFEQQRSYNPETNLTPGGNARYCSVRE